MMVDPAIREMWQITVKAVKYLEHWKSTHSWIWGLPGGVLGAGATWLAKKIAPRTMLQHMFSESSVARVIVPQMHIPSFVSQHTSRRHTLPSNAPLLPLGDSMAIQMIADAVRSSLGIKKETEFRALPWADVNFISVGGPSINPFARNKLSDFETLLKFDRETDAFELCGSTYAAKMDAKKTLILDYGFILVHTDVDTRLRSVCLWGKWPTGTHAAAKEFLRSDRLSTWQRYREWVWSGSSETSHLRGKLRKLFKSERSIVALVSATPAGPADCSVTLVAVHEVPRS